MNLVVQPVQSNLCGQACVAMLVNQSLDDVIKIMGRGKTSYTDMRTALAWFGHTLGVTNRCRAFINLDGVRSLCHNYTLLRLHFTGVKNKSHWVIFDLREDMIYDPSLKHPAYRDDYERYMQLPMFDAYFTSYAYIKGRA